MRTILTPLFLLLSAQVFAEGDPASLKGIRTVMISVRPLALRSDKRASEFLEDRKESVLIEARAAMRRAGVIVVDKSSDAAKSSDAIVEIVIAGVIEDGDITSVTVLDVVQVVEIPRLKQRFTAVTWSTEEALGINSLSKGVIDQIGTFIDAWKVANR